MSVRPVQAASLPPAGITGLNPEWSRLVEVHSEYDQGIVTWHLLDSWNTQQAKQNPSAVPALTILCVHGNPSWSFLWRKVVAAAPASVRVIAVDQLGMGYSQRTAKKRPLATRINDLCQLTETLALKGPVVTLAHDWGGPVSMGWAQKQINNTTAADAAVIKGVVLTNTAVHQPPDASAPAVIRLIRSRLLLRAMTVTSTAFIRGAYIMSKPALPQAVREGFLAPYRTADRRAAIADFVADIPLTTQHESATTLDAIAQGMQQLSDVPALLLWGPRDRVFSDLYLQDLEQRLPQADVHRYPGAAHFVSEDVDVSGAVLDWVSLLDADSPTSDQGTLKLNDSALGAELIPKASTTERRALADFSEFDASTTAVMELVPEKREINFGQLKRSTEHLASGLLASGVKAGDRVAVMIMPGIDLAKVVYACWRLGAVLVLVDSGLGRQGMQKALQGARPDYLIGINKALLAAKLLGWPGQRISLSQRSPSARKFLQITNDVESLIEQGREHPVPPWPHKNNLAAIAFTSGSTGPSKGVLYTHEKIQAQRDQLMSLYSITASDSLVAAFAPFALYGPTLGISSIVPDMNVTKPGSLTASALATAVQAINATLVFASPAALVNAVATASELTSEAQQACDKVRIGLSAGAPVRASLLESAGVLFPNASMHTPYGMTELLPLADISLEQLRAIESSRANGEDLMLGEDAGVCVGAPVQGSVLLIDPLGEEGLPTGDVTQQAGVLGEILVAAEHKRHGYDRLWHTQHQASHPVGFHRTGDVGQLDAKARLWVGGRLAHILTTPNGVIAPVSYEQQLERIDKVNSAAVVGIGPTGHQLVIAVLQMHHRDHAKGAASLSLTQTVRATVSSSIDVAAVLVVETLPVDKRHNSKVDRTAVARWASAVLSGDRVSGP